MTQKKSEWLEAKRVVAETLVASKACRACQAPLVVETATEAVAVQAPRVEKAAEVEAKARGEVEGTDAGVEVVVVETEAVVVGVESFHFPRVQTGHLYSPLSEVRLQEQWIRKGEQRPQSTEELV